uniref:ANAPC4_WD40 domain-containing protein n=1 Tax=Macrostomum lignano TaxID=282301 RepID=A0A1I8F7G7_9PLAT
AADSAEKAQQQQQCPAVQLSERNCEAVRVIGSTCASSAWQECRSPRAGGRLARWRAALPPSSAAASSLGDWDGAEASLASLRGRCGVSPAGQKIAFRWLSSATWNCWSLGAHIAALCPDRLHRLSGLIMCFQALRSSASFSGLRPARLAAPGRLLLDSGIPLPPSQHVLSPDQLTLLADHSCQAARQRAIGLQPGAGRPPGRCTCASSPPMGRFLARGGRDCVAIVWLVEAAANPPGARRGAAPPDSARSARSAVGVAWLAWSPDSRLCFACCGRGGHRSDRLREDDAHAVLAADTFAPESGGYRFDTMQDETLFRRTAPTRLCWLSARCSAGVHSVGPAAACVPAPPARPDSRRYLLHASIGGPNQDFVASGLPRCRVCVWHRGCQAGDGAQQHLLPINCRATAAFLRSAGIPGITACWRRLAMTARVRIWLPASLAPPLLGSFGRWHRPAAARASPPTAAWLQA